MASESANGLNGDYDDDAALEAAIALSLASASTTPTPSQAQEATAKPASSSAAFGGLVMDRKQMEQERLARQKKRSAEQAGLDPPTTSKRLTPSSPRKAAPPAASALPGHSLPSREQLPFAKGVVKRTWARGCQRSGDDIKIEEIWDRDNLQLAVVSSFMWDEEWMLSKVDLNRTRMLLVAYANGAAQQQEIRSNVPSARIRFCFPAMAGGGYMHSKLQLLKFKSHLRIVVPSGNLVPYDWGETGQLENIVFLIDLPLLEQPPQKDATARSVSQTPFGRSLRKFLAAQGLDNDMVQSLEKYDFAETLQYGFIHSISGPHTDTSEQDTGYCGLGKAVTELGLRNETPIDVHYLTSSLGSLDYQFLKAMYYACQGDSGMKEYQERQSRQRKSKADTSIAECRLASGPQKVQLQDHFRVYFPSENTVAASRGGKNAAGTICFQEKWWRAATFPRETVRDSVNTRTGILMHSKAIFTQASSRDATVSAWAYVGSANLSESAWGRLVKDRSTGVAKLNCRNWECGVLVPVKGSVSSKRSNTSPISQSPSQCDLAAFHGTVPVPMNPASKGLADADGDDQPWFFQTHN